MRKLSKQDVISLFDQVQEQLKEDRESINDIYGELREFVRVNETRYVDLGEVLAKLADLKLKQTAQVLDALKTIDKAVPKDDDFDDFSEGDLDMIHQEISKEDGNKLC